MEAIDRERLTREYVEAWNDGDPDAVAGFFASDATYDDRGAGELLSGRTAIRAHAAAVISAFPDLRFELLRIAHGEGFTAGEWRAEMTHRGELFGLGPTGRHAQSAGVDVASVGDDGLIGGLVSYYDGAELMRQLGLLPGRGSGAERALLRVFSLLRAGRAGASRR